jgi:hypothetical protein
MRLRSTVCLAVFLALALGVSSAFAECPQGKKDCPPDGASHDAPFDHPVVHAGLPALGVTVGTLTARSGTSAALGADYRERGMAILPYNRTFNLYTADQRELSGSTDFRSRFQLHGLLSQSYGAGAGPVLAIVSGRLQTDAATGQKASATGTGELELAAHHSFADGNVTVLGGRYYQFGLGLGVESGDAGLGLVTGRGYRGQLAIGSRLIATADRGTQRLAGQDLKSGLLMLELMNRGGTRGVFGQISSREAPPWNPESPQTPEVKTAKLGVRIAR